MKIVLNAGHCPGLDSGAVGSFLQEALVAKDISSRTAGYLRAVGYEVLEVQENELEDIVSTSNSFPADLFVSIHCNSAVNTEANGTETFYYSFGGTSEKLAKCIQRQLVDSLGTTDRGVKSANFYVIKYTDAPAVLVETAFISNPTDEQLLSEKADEFARAIARGITDYVQEVN